MLRLAFPLDCLDYWSRQLQKIGEGKGCFELVFSQVTAHKLFDLFIVIEDHENHSGRHQIEQGAQGQIATSLAVDFPVEMISFHGPHFQDRDGIANVAFGVLAKAEIRILAAGCTGTSIYMVVPDNMGGSAIQLLEKVFEVPQDKVIKIKN